MDYLGGRFTRIFSIKETAKNLTWHAEQREVNGYLHHPADTPSWKLIDYTWLSFASELRNLRLALSADGINPHSSLSSSKVVNVAALDQLQADVVETNLSEFQTERRNKVTLNHGLSRGGYVGLEERIQRATSVYDPVPREDLWVEARKTNNGEFRSEDVKEKAEKITDLKKQVADGEISFQPGERHDQSRPLAKDQSTPIARLSKGTFCKLALGDDLNIVSQGMVFVDNEPNATVHGIPLASTDVRVSIDVAYQKNAILPRPVRDELILCPRQPKYVEHCGYYVMKYMWDIVANTNVSIPEKFVKIQSYTQKEIDEVRCEWAREGQSTTRPPYFDGNDYPYWKIRMRIYLQAIDYEIWEIVNDGPFMPLTINEVGKDIPKPSREWNEFEKRKAFLNCTLDKKEFHRVSSCESANEIWHKLEVVYEGMKQVKEFKINRFTNIVNTLGALGKTFSNSEEVKKIIRSLPKEWRPKRTPIEEAKDLNVLPIDDLIGSLISYEENLAVEKGHQEKKKNIALKASKRESNEESEMEELAMLARRFRKFYKKNNEQRKFRGYKNKNEKKDPITCYECKKPGHIQPKCPLLNKLKKKAMVATWDDSDEETSDDEEQQEMTNLALMAVGEESCDELDEGLKKKKNKWIPQQNGVLKRKNMSIQEMARTMLNENSLPKYLWAKAVNTACYGLNRVLIRPNLNKTPYELWKDRKLNIGYFKVFGCKCFVLNTTDNLGKFDPKSDVGIFLGYSKSSKAYRVYNKRPLVVEKSMHVTFDESNPFSTEKVVVGDNAEDEQREEASIDNQKDAPHGIQEEHHKETNAEQNEEFSSCMSKEFEMSMMGELKYFLGLQIKQNEEGIFINQAKYVKDLLKRFSYDNRTTKSTPMSTTIKLNKDEKGKEVDIKTYRDVGWLNALVFKENVYPDLVKVFYSNMDFFAEKENRVITTIGGVLIEFDDSELNSILGTSVDGLEIFSPRKPPDIDDYVYIDAVKNICRRIDLSDKDCTIHFRTQCLCLQTQILLRIIQSIVLPRSGHLDEVSHMDVALIDYILRHRPVDLGYTIIRNMLSIPKLITRSLPYGHFITRILKYFDVPIQEPSCRPSKGIGDDVIFGLGFEWKNGTWVKYTENKFTFFALSDDRPLNTVVPADQLLIFSLSFRAQRRHRDPPVIASAPGASASASSPPQPPTSEEVTLQQLMDEVQTLSVRQTKFQQQQLIHGQRLLFKHFGIAYPYPPPSPPSSPPQ
ncbi:hypothetical protein KPL70_011578 [Citrus sinensis]|nr:hypothetical protein KPL70_011578 [Citrus sinensis]